MSNDTRKRLIKEQDSWAHHQGPSNLSPPALATAQGLLAATDDLAELHAIDQFVSTLRRGQTIQARYFACHHQISPHIETRKKAAALC